MSHNRTRRRGQMVSIGLVTCALSLTLVGCSSANSGKDDDSSAGVTNSDAKAALAAVTEASKPVESVTPPGPAVAKPADLKGKTVMFLPIGLKVAYFQTQARGIEEGMAKAGAKVIDCDGEFTPSGVTKCIDQAIGSKVDAVLSDAVPIQMASTSFARLASAGIPTLLYAAEAPPGGAPKDLVFRDAQWTQFAAATLSAQAVIADSNGDAKVLYVKIIDSPSLEAMGDKAVATFKEQCKKCEVTVKTLNSANMAQQLPSIVSGALLKDNSIDYVMPQADALLPSTVTGIQNASATSRVKISTTSGSLGGLQLLKSNKSVIADVGYSAHYLGWVTADSLIRMLSGVDVPTEYSPMVRVFNRDNIDDLELTPAKEKTNDWYGTAEYQTLFPKLWGQG